MTEILNNWPETQPTTKNAARCALCNDIVHSTYRHDFVSCSCGEIFVDGGNDYQRCGAKDFKNVLRITDAELEEHYKKTKVSGSVVLHEEKK
jgi:hypothetical protein